MKLRNILIIGGIVFIFVLGMMGCFVLSVHPLYFEKFREYLQKTLL